jgi:CDP-diacylglycerol--serine O-phosphatidyltransferase
MKFKRKLVEILPSIFTSGNLLSGFFAVVFLIEKKYILSAWFIIIGMFFDLLDGRIARLTKKTSDFGAELDSLCDLLTFGLAPALLSYYYLLYNVVSIENLKMWVLLSFIYLLCGAIRLARFNVSPTTDNFEGLPIPGAAFFIATLALYNLKSSYAWFGNNIYVLSGSILLVSYLMVSSIPYPSFKKGGKKIVKLIAVSLILVAILIDPYRMLFYFAIIYVLAGPVYFAYLSWRSISKRSRNLKEKEAF